MAEWDKGAGGFNLSRRDFLKASAATAAIGGVGIDFAVRTSRADAATVANTFNDVDAAGNVLDIYGDPKSPFNAGGLCAKGAGTYQLVTNARRLGAWAGPHPVNDVFASDGTGNPVAYKRIGNEAWTRVPLDTALTDIAGRFKTARAVDSSGWDPANVVPANRKYNSKSVAFFGSSHLNNEPCYVYRKFIANFGTSNVEHQARI